MTDQDSSREDRHPDPTPRRLQKAREEGQVPRSGDPGHPLVLGAALAVVLTGSGPVLAAGRQHEGSVAACLRVNHRIRLPLARPLRRRAPRLRRPGHTKVADTRSIRIGRPIGDVK